MVVVTEEVGMAHLPLVKVGMVLLHHSKVVTAPLLLNKAVMVLLHSSRVALQEEEDMVVVVVDPSMVSVLRLSISLLALLLVLILSFVSMHRSGECRHIEVAR